MKNIIRDTNETKDVAAFIASVSSIEGSDKLQLYYDMECTNPVPKEEALIYIASGKACAAIFEEGNEILTFGNMGGKFIVQLDDSCPNGYYLSEVDPAGGDSLICVNKLSYTAEQNGILTLTDELGGASDYDPYDLISSGLVFNNPEDFSGYYVSVKLHSDYSATGLGYEYAMVLMFNSAIKLMENDGKSYGIMSFSGFLDSGNETEALPVTLRFTVGTNGVADERRVDLILPH